jgi:steroid 5-alpha reductase family enzyme
MKCSYSKWPSIALIAAIYLLAALIGVAVYFAVDSLMILDFTATNQPLLGLFAADVVATIVVWAFGLLYENVSVYDPYWSVFPPVTYLLWAFHTGVWSLPVILLLIASWYWGWRLTRNWAITFKGIAHEDWRYTKYRSLHPALFHLINFFGLNMVPTLVVFAAMLPGLKLYEWSIVNYQLSIINYCLLAIGILVCLASATIQLIADKQSHDFRAAHPGEVCNVGLWKHGRHPNYFGEIQFWWGIWIMYAAFNGFDWFILGPVAMTALFLGISIPLMEHRQLANKPAYAAYRKQTRILI